MRSHHDLNPHFFRNTPLAIFPMIYLQSISVIVHLLIQALTLCRRRTVSAARSHPYGKQSASRFGPICVLLSDQNGNLLAACAKKSPIVGPATVVDSERYGLLGCLHGLLEY